MRLLVAVLTSSFSSHLCSCSSARNFGTSTLTTTATRTTRTLFANRIPSQFLPRTASTSTSTSTSFCQEKSLFTVSSTTIRYLSNQIDDHNSAVQDNNNNNNNSNGNKDLSNRIKSTTKKTMTAASTDTLLQVKFLNDNATMPKRGSPLSAGFDLSASEPNIVPPGGRAVIKTGLSICCPVGTYARIAPRSGLAVKKMIDVGAGVVDADYRGEVGVVLFNFGKEPFDVRVGDRIAQLILELVCMVDAIQVNDLSDTIRGVGGFGSTGVTATKVLDAQMEKKPRKE